MNQNVCYNTKEHGRMYTPLVTARYKSFKVSQNKQTTASSSGLRWRYLALTATNPFTPIVNFRSLKCVEPWVFSSPWFPKALSILRAYPDNGFRQGLGFIFYVNTISNVISKFHSHSALRSFYSVYN